MLSWSTTSTWKQREQFTAWKHREQFTAWGAPAVTLASADCIRLQEEPRNTEF